VCFGGTSRDSTTVKEAVFCNFDWKYLSYCLQTPPADIRCDEGGSLEGPFIKKHIPPLKYIRSDIYNANYEVNSKIYQPKLTYLLFISERGQ
jgi:hypothetical protein